MDRPSPSPCQVDATFSLLFIVECLGLVPWVVAMVLSIQLFAIARAGNRKSWLEYTKEYTKALDTPRLWNTPSWLDYTKARAVPKLIGIHQGFGPKWHGKPVSTGGYSSDFSMERARTHTHTLRHTQFWKMRMKIHRQFIFFCIFSIFSHHFWRVESCKPVLF